MVRAACPRAPFALANVFVDGTLEHCEAARDGTLIAFMDGAWDGATHV
jgi:hypothetical protein